MYKPVNIPLTLKPHSSAAAVIGDVNPLRPPSWRGKQGLCWGIGHTKSYKCTANRDGMANGLEKCGLRGGEAVKARGCSPPWSAVSSLSVHNQHCRFSGLGGSLGSSWSPSPSLMPPPCTPLLLGKSQAGEALAVRKDLQMRGCCHLLAATLWMGEGRRLGWFSLVAASNSQALGRIILDGFWFILALWRMYSIPVSKLPIPGVPVGFLT